MIDSLLKPPYYKDDLGAGHNISWYVGWSGDGFAIVIRLNWKFGRIFYQAKNSHRYFNISDPNWFRELKELINARH